MPINKLEALRGHLQVDAFLVPTSDEYLGEYVPPSAERLAWLTDFTGSAGMAVITKKDAALFVDGRYTVQAKQQAQGYTIFNIADKRAEQWLSELLPEGARVGFDARLHSVREAERLRAVLGKKNITLVALAENPIDALWTDRPAVPNSEVRVHPLEKAGRSHEEKIVQCAKTVAEKPAAAALLTATDSINWLLNIRGRDVEFSPLALSFALLHADQRVTLFIAPSRVSAEVKQHLGAQVDVQPLEALPQVFASLSGKHVMMDAASTPEALAEMLKQAGAQVVQAEDPCTLPKALKNEVELEGIRAAHLRDGLALTRFLCWLEEETQKRSVTEMEVMAVLREFRAAAPEFISPSFESIAGSGPHGAIVHYRSTEATNRALQKGELFLLDSGGQYEDGTTDVTRTVAIGTPTEEMKKHFTLVLKGHIALALARFPAGTCGSSLDALARQFLWAEGLDYDHGTGHGVGHFLNVHEGPQRISKRAGDAPLQPGMIVSNEPGYYREGAYGIRIENLVAVVEAGNMENGKPKLGFETLTCAPLDRRVIIPSLLTKEEKSWLDSYHRWVYEMHAPHMSAEEKRWLRRATASL